MGRVALSSRATAVAMAGVRFVARNRRLILSDGFWPDRVHRNPIFPTQRNVYYILQDRDLYQLGGDYYGPDTALTEYEIAWIPHGRCRDEYPMGAIPEELP